LKRAIGKEPEGYGSTRVNNTGGDRYPIIVWGWKGILLNLSWDEKEAEKGKR